MFDVKEFLRLLTTHPGVYQMFDKNQKMLYVGKARNLKKRVSSYFKKTLNYPKTVLMMSQVDSIKIIVTHSENEALILENQLIKQYHPRYNILFRDDKSYPYIFITDDVYPQITIHRGPQKEKGHYFGPYPQASYVHETIHLLQKIFRIRNCKKSFFASRNRPCLQYQIHQCTAPCVDLISKENYANTIRHVEMFLNGKENNVLKELFQQMEKASKALDYEKAAFYRDQIQHIREIQSKQFVCTQKGDIDVIALVTRLGVTCIAVMIIRQGRLLGSKIFFPHIPLNSVESEVMTSFISQYYFNCPHDIPKEIIVSIKIENNEWLSNILTSQAHHPVKLTTQVKAVNKAQWIKMSVTNAEEALNTRTSTKAYLCAKFIDLQQKLKLQSGLHRIECFDVSHTMGEATIASCIAFSQEGALKSDYRCFNIHNIKAGDDFAAMRQALTRRFRKIQNDESKLPDLLIIDGGKGQLTQAEIVLKKFNLKTIVLIGIAKGVERKSGCEMIYLSSHGDPIFINSHSLAFHLIQQVRDEAHRFAITSHRKRRAKTRQTSILEMIDGIGAKRRVTLLKYFGGLQGVIKASVDDLMKVQGISQHLAEHIYQSLRK